jgi:hypothetical protein
MPKMCATPSDNTDFVKQIWQHLKQKYRVIKKSLCAWWLWSRKLQVTFKVSPASPQTFIDMPSYVLKDRVHYSTVHVPNVFCDDHLQLISCVYCNRQVYRDFLITLYYPEGPLLAILQICTANCPWNPVFILIVGLKMFEPKNLPSSVICKTDGTP